jgi:hypothetical protein
MGTVDINKPETLFHAGFRISDLPAELQSRILKYVCYHDKKVTLLPSSGTTQDLHLTSHIAKALAVSSTLQPEYLLRLQKHLTKRPPKVAYVNVVDNNFLTFRTFLNRIRDPGKTLSSYFFPGITNSACLKSDDPRLTGPTILVRLRFTSNFDLDVGMARLERYFETVSRISAGRGHLRVLYEVEAVEQGSVGFADMMGQWRWKLGEWGEYGQLRFYQHACLVFFDKSLGKSRLNEVKVVEE